MGDALRGTPEANLPRPPGIVSVRINSKTGQATGSNDQNAIIEIFRKEFAPTYSPSSSVAKNIDDTHTTSSKDHTDEQPIF